MPEVKIYNLEGKANSELKLNETVFGVKAKKSLVHQVFVALIANLRQPWAHVKNKGEVRGGGRKPWQQKGTGRARHGSIRSPIWKGGGVTFGPR
ncbi:MAG: 50S ribosomal protein L4, partial [Candidatus Uhrbacteria bacterium]